VIALLAVLVSADDESVNAGAVSVFEEFDVGATYAAVVIGIDAIDTGEVPSIVVAVIVSV
jgi:hypothetical protein